MLETRQFHLLQVIAATGSYTAAGRELGLTQPAVTYQMRTLEGQVGTALTVRRGRQMKLTPAGEALLAHADRVIAAVRAAMDDLGTFAGRDAGAVRIASFPSASATLVADAMGALRTAAPKLRVALDEHEPEPARSLVRRGDADLAITYRFVYPSGRPVEPMPAVPDGFSVIPLLSDRSFVVLPTGHPMLEFDELSVEMLQDEHWLLASDNFRWLLSSAAEDAGFSPRIGSVADDYVTMQALVARRLGIAVIPGLALSAHKSRSVEARPLRDWPIREVMVELWPDLMKAPAVQLATAALSGAALHRTEGAVGGSGFVPAAG